MQLFDIIDNKISFAPQALEIKVFKALWLRDKTKHKERANAELAFVYFYSDYKSIYATITDDDERAVIIYDTLDMKEKPDDLVYEACNYYKERQNTHSMNLLLSARIATKKMEDFLASVDFTEEDSKGNLKYDINKVANILGNIAKIVENLAALQDQVQKELEESGTMRGSRAKNIFEDGI